MIRLDPSALAPEEFAVTLVPPGFIAGVDEPLRLVVPRKNKFSWRVGEEPFRSVLLRQDGTVVSTGFPKFFNVGERPAEDERLWAALAEGRVRFLEKLDGSLLIADRLAGRLHLRTRGVPQLDTRILSRPDLPARPASHEVPFGEVIDALLAERYPAIARAAAGDGGEAARLFARCTFLFEYTGPRHRIICRYDTPRLALLALIDKETLRILMEPGQIAALAAELGVDTPAVVELPADRAAMIATVKALVGREGVVAVVPSADGAVTLTKLKGDWYRAAAAIAAGMSGERAMKLCYLFGLTSLDEVTAHFTARYAIDAETVEYLTPLLAPHFARRDQVWAEYRSRRTAWEALGAAIRADLSLATPGARKHAFVQRIGALLETVDAKSRSRWQAMALMTFDGKPDEEIELVVDAVALGQAPPTLLQWRRETQREIDSEISAAASSVAD